MEPCKYEKEIGALVEATSAFKEFMHEMRDNHLSSIYEQLKEIREKMSSRRPTWSVAIILTLLSSACVGLLIALIK